MKETNLQPPSSTPPNSPGEWDQFTRQAAIVILMLGVLLLISVLRSLLNLLAVTGIFILILSYPVNKLRARTKMAYPLAVFTVFVPLAILLSFFFVNLVQWSFQNAHSLVAQVQANTAFIESVNLLMAQVPGSIAVSAGTLGKLAAILDRQLALTMQFMTLTAISFFLAFLFILEMPSNLAHSFSSLSDVSQHEFGILFDRLSNVWNGWLRSTVITSIIVGATTALVLYLFGIPYAGILGVTAGFLNLIPTIGPLISYLLIILVTYTQGSTRLSLSPGTLTILVLGVIMLINSVVRLYIFPKLAGKAAHLPVFLVILGLVVAGVLWGVVGLILVVPLLGSVGALLNYVLAKINRKDPYPGEQPQAGFWAREITEK